jgi:N-acyl-D-aspartate/D-glutamate deacylase
VATYDFIIRNGTIVDGSGAEPYEGDVAIRNGLIAAVGKVHGTGREELDARGLLVTPGFVDVHTHFDGHVTWSDRLLPLSVHGVTTALMGNCGVGFAPCKPEDRERLVRLMEGVEDIPGIVLTEGLPWNWTSFPEYLDSLSGRSFDMDFGAQLPHAPLRVFVMGQRAADREAATDEDIEQMKALAREAMRAGAFGFSTSRSINHRASDGAHTPSLQASQREVIEIAGAIGDTGTGVLQMISDFENIDADFDLLRRIAARARRPLSMTLVQLPHAPTRWRALLERIEQANRDGLPIRGQVCGRPVGLFLGLELSYTPFSLCPSMQTLDSAPFAEKLAVCRDASFRARVLEEFKVPLEDRKAEIAKAFAGRTVDTFSMARLLTNLSGMFALGDPPNYEPAPSSSLTAIAQRTGQDAASIAYDALLEQDGHGLIYVPAANYVDGNLDSVRTLLAHENTILGLSDAGAHCSLICDASFTTYMLTHWARDRAVGLPLPSVVHALTQQGAHAIGLTDRGTIAPGLRADLNVIDFSRLHLRPPRVVYDLPAGGKRLSQTAEGYVLTMVNGIPTYREGEPTGALPGRLLRNRSEPMRGVAANG